MVITYFEKTATFTQRIKLTGNKGTTVKGELEFMVCDDTNCLPPTYVDLVFEIPAPAKGSTPKETTEDATDTEESDEVAATTDTDDAASAETTVENDKKTDDAAAIVTKDDVATP